MRLPRFSITACLMLLLLLARPTSAQTLTQPPDTASLRAIETQVARIRGLSPLAEPDLQLLDHTALNAYLAEQFTQNYLPNERESDQKELVALGLLKPTDDLVQIQLKLLNDQVVGLYDPDAKSMFVLSGVGGDSFGPAVRITYAHEFNHALQDQYYDLNTLAPKHPDSNDHSLAVHALLEGDAVMLQTLWAQQYLSRDELVQLTSDGEGADAGLAEAPLIIRSELLFPYTDGLDFVRQLYRQAGNNYAAVNAVFANPPESTAQVLHPDKYRAQVHPVGVTLPDLAASLGPDWRTVGSGVLGELDTRILLEQWGATVTDANRVAAGWTGDHWQLVDNNGATGMVLKSTWASPGAAGEFFSAYTRGLRARFAGASMDDSSSNHEALSTRDYATDVTLDGNQVLVVLAADRDTANQIVGAVTSSSSATSSTSFAL